jgi:hypothetical protein
MSALRGKADNAATPAPYQSDATDPSATLADEFCCDAQQGVRSECDSFSSVSLGNREHG